MNNQRVPSSSTFQPAIETLLFNDIIEEKSLILRDLMDQFLQVHSFSRFESEFNLFSRRVKHIARDGQRDGTNRTRHTMQMPSDIGTQPLSKQSECGGSQENNRQHAKSANTFKRPLAAEYKPRTTLTHNNQLNNITHTTNNLFDTIIEESHDTAQKDAQQHALRPTAPITYSKSSQFDNASPTTFNNENASELAGSVIMSNMSDDSSAYQLSQDKFKRSEKSKVKYLTKWSVNTRQIKSNEGNSKPVIILKGTLLAEDQITVLKKVHKAGILIVRKTKQIVKTDNGLYHLIGPIIEGSPQNLYRACVEINGIPKTWRNILANVSTEVEKNLNESMTRKGTIYNKDKVASPNNSGTKGLFGRDLLNDSDFRQQLTQLSTSKITKPFEACHTPSQLLKHKFHQKYVKACLVIGSQKNTDEEMEE